MQKKKKKINNCRTFCTLGHRILNFDERNLGPAWKVKNAVSAKASPCFYTLLRNIQLNDIFNLTGERNFGTKLFWKLFSALTSACVGNVTEWIRRQRIFIHDLELKKKKCQVCDSTTSQILTYMSVKFGHLIFNAFVFESILKISSFCRLSAWVVLLSRPRTSTASVETSPQELIPQRFVTFAEVTQLLTSRICV